MSTIGELIGTSVKAVKVPWKYDGVDLVKIDSNELIGIEVEVENTQWIDRVTAPWHLKEDGSLRNDGRELITDPIPASSAPVALYHLLSKVLSQDCSFSMRTSIHVHLNALDMTEAQVRDFVALYTIFEPALFNFAGRGRWKSVFCVPLNECVQLHIAHARKLSDGRWEKYTSLNLRRLSDIGTIEFRHMAGTFDVDRVSQWIAIICKLKTYVLEAGTTKIRKDISQLAPHSDYNELAQRIFQEFAHLLGVSDPAVYYPASLNAREIIQTKACETFRTEIDSPLNLFYKLYRSK